MTSTNVNIGLEGMPRNSSKVLKPPGGGSSDIFGVDPSEPRRVRNTNHLQSSVFGDMMETATPKSKIETSHGRLFGEFIPSVTTAQAKPSHTNVLGLPEPSVTLEVKEAEIKDEVVEEVDSMRVGDGDLNRARDNSRRNPINHSGMTEADCSQSYTPNNRTRGARNSAGNPVTGEGYAIANGVKEMAASPVAAAPSPVKVNGEAKTNGTVASPPPPQSAQARGRVPPGGYSSGLW